MKTYNDVIRFIDKYAAEIDKKLTNVVIQGETGAGKEVVLQHFISKLPCGKRGVSVINCSAIPSELIESEMFGHERGAFTGAVQNKKGFFETAERWLVFDEITSMSLPFQAKILRAMESGTFYRVGGGKEISCNLRFAALTNVPLVDAVNNGIFRKDLMYRLCGIVINIPPLRERKKEIIPLFEKFCSKKVSSQARDRLLSYQWPGNVRELRNVAVRAAILSGDGGTVRTKHLGLSYGENGVSDLGDKMQQLIAACEFDKKRIIERLDISQATFYRQLDRLGIKDWFHHKVCT